MTIEWTETARQDLREIRRFIARDSKKYAARMIARIREAGRVALLERSQQPWMCHCFGVFGEAVPMSGKPLEEHCFSEDSEAVARLGLG